jgi:hypothetical protein
MNEPADDGHPVPPKKRIDIHDWMQNVSGALKQRGQLAKSKWVKRSEFVRRWIPKVIWGCAIEIVIHVAGHTYQFGPLVAAQNWGLDVANRLSVRHCSIFGHCPDSEPLVSRPILVRIDDETWRDPAWGSGEPERAPRTELADLVDHAFQLGARQVIVDIAVEDRPSPRASPSIREGGSAQTEPVREPFAYSLEPLLTKTYFGLDRKLILVRAERRPLPIDEGQFLPELKQSASVDRLIAKSNDRVSAAAPYFEVSSDQVLREWDLFRVVCERQPGAANDGRMRVVPSVQLLTRAHDHGIPSNVVEPLPSTPCQPFPQQGLHDASQSTIGQAPCEKTPAGDESHEPDELCPSSQSSKGTAELKRKYWDGVQAAFLAASAPIGELPDVGDVGNRIVFRYTPDKVDVLPALQLLSASGEFMQQWRDQVRGRVVVIGQTFEEAGDKYFTPLGRMPGAVVLVNAIDSMARSQLMREPGLHVFIFSILTILMVSYISARVPPLFATTIATLVVIVVSGGASFLFYSNGIWLDFSAPIIGIQIERWIESIKERRELSESSTESIEEE